MEANNTIQKTQVYNLVILDKSGSMNSIRQEAIDGFNETLASIRAAQDQYRDTQDHFISLAAFCSCGIQMIYDRTPIAQAQPLLPAQYQPCCLTPLFDAIGITVSGLRGQIDPKTDTVLVTIITDGRENASKEWKGAAVCQLIDECKADGWMFSFIGAGEDVLTVATTISIENQLFWYKTHTGTRQMFTEENNARERFYGKVNDAMCCASFNLSAFKEKRKQFSREYYDKDSEKKE